MQGKFLCLLFFSFSLTNAITCTAHGGGVIGRFDKEGSANMTWLQGLPDNCTKIIGHLHLGWFCENFAYKSLGGTAFELYFQRNGTGPSYYESEFTELGRMKCPGQLPVLQEGTTLTFGPTRLGPNGGTTANCVTGGFQIGSDISGVVDLKNVGEIDGSLTVYGGEYVTGLKALHLKKISGDFIVSVKDHAPHYSEIMTSYLGDIKWMTYKEPQGVFKTHNGRYSADGDPLIFPNASIPGSQVYDNIYTWNKVFKTIEFPMLNHITGDFIFYNNPNITELILPNLTQIDGIVDIQKNPLLKLVEFKKLNTTGNVSTAHFINIIGINSVLRNGGNVGNNADLEIVLGSLLNCTKFVTSNFNVTCGNSPTPSPTSSPTPSPTPSSDSSSDSSTRGNGKQRNERKMPYHYGVIMSKRGAGRKVIYRRFNTLDKTP